MLAYYDSLAGLVPCRVDSVRRVQGGRLWRLTSTAARGPYAKGARIESNSIHVIPRTALRRRRYHTLILRHDWRAILAADPKAADLLAGYGDD
jgi:hypothetical protein